jgi:hypothetical protein
MDMSDLALSLPAGLGIAALLLVAFLGAILPTCLYVYVEPRGRTQWATAGDTPSTRRAPLLVRLTAWLSFAIGQTAVALLLVPVTCGGLLYVQIRLGALSPIGLGITGALGLAALVQAALALQLVPLGVRLLARNAREGQRAASLARLNGTIHGVILAGALSLGWAMRTMPGLVRPVLRHTLEWTAVRPVAAFAIVCLLQALLLGRSGQLMQDKQDK